MSGNKRNASDSSVLSDHQSDNHPSKKAQITPLIEKNELLPDNIQSLAQFFVDKLNTLHLAINESIEHVSDKIDNANKQYENLLEKYRDLEKEHQLLSVANTRLKNDISQLREDHLRLETYQRRNNMVFTGIGEVQKETSQQCKSKLIETLSSITGSSEFLIGRCHRLGQQFPGATRDIIAHFPNENDITCIIQNRSRLPKGVYTHEDLPAEIESRKRELRPIYQMAKSSENFKDVNVRLKQDKLIIGRSTYTVRPNDNLHQLPPELNPIKACYQENDYAYTFFGKRHPLSNFYEVPIQVGEKTYSSAEHYIQEQKALIFNNTDLAKKIFEASTPASAKRMAKDVIHYNHQKWVESIPRVLDTILKHKVDQHPICKKTLQSTTVKMLGEATRDFIFGTGFSLADERTNKLETNNWTGKNLLGKAFEKLRDTLS